MERGKQALAQGQGREAAIAYAHAAQIEPNNPYIHLGLAEANLALGDYGVVFMAARKVQELQSEGGTAATMAQALLDLLDRRYDRAMQNVEAVTSEDPGNAYAHAMRAYLLRLTGNDYDAGLARSRAARLSYAAPSRTTSHRLIRCARPAIMAWAAHLLSLMLTAQMAQSGRAHAIGTKPVHKSITIRSQDGHADPAV
jgi:tetratricopeptide (TPR) repeat protein